MDLVETRVAQSSSPNRHPWELARVEVIRLLLEKHCPSFSMDQTVTLDIGCGDAFMIEAFSRLWPHARFFGVDTGFDEQIINGINQRLNNHRIHLLSSLDSAKENLGNKLDLVLLLDVIEHVEDDAGLLRKVSDISQFGSNTHLLITAPAFQFLFSNHDRFLRHYRRYTAASMERLLKAEGFFVLQCGYFFFLPIFWRILEKCRERIPYFSAPSTGLGDWRGGPFLTGLVKAMLLWDFSVCRFFARMGIRLPGMSGYVLCKKPTSHRSG